MEATEIEVPIVDQLAERLAAQKLDEIAVYLEAIDRPDLSGSI